MKEKLLSLKNKPVVLLAVAAVLLLLSTVGATQAAITTYSENYQAKIQAPTVTVSLLENQGTEQAASFVEIGNSDELTLLTTMLNQSEGKLIPGKTYMEELKVQNKGNADAYVRVVITKNWLDNTGKIDRMLSPENIEMNLVKTGDWMEDTSASTDERTVLYYTNVLPAYDKANPNESMSSIFLKDLKIRSGFDLFVKEETVSENAETGYKVIQYSHTYDGYKMNVNVEVDAVQTYDAKEAIKSEWGVDVTLVDGKIISIN